jgi:hypothetical protein
MPFIAPILQWGGRGLAAGVMANDLGAFDPGPGRGARAPHPAALWEDDVLPPGAVSFARPIHEQPLGVEGLNRMVGRGMLGYFPAHDIPSLAPPAARLYQRGVQRLPNTLGPMTGIREGAGALVGPNVRKEGTHAAKQFIKKTVPGAGKHIVRKGVNFLPRVLFGASAQLAATPLNAAMEAADAVGLLPEWAGGTGMWNPGWKSDKQFHKDTTFNPDNPTIWGIPDPTGGYLDYLGASLNSWATPIRSTYETGKQLALLPKNVVDISNNSRVDAAIEAEIADRDAFNQEYPGVTEAWENRPLDSETYPNVSSPTISEIVNSKNLGITNDDLRRQWGR